jgi:hypothetical protein
MLYRLSKVVAAVPIAAAAPMLLHGVPTKDCNLRVELCGLSEIAYLPDEPTPEPAPPLIFARAATAINGSSSVNLRANDLITGAANIGSPSFSVI